MFKHSVLMPATWHIITQPLHTIPPWRKLLAESLHMAWQLQLNCIQLCMWTCRCVPTSDYSRRAIAAYNVVERCAAAAVGALWRFGEFALPLCRMCSISLLHTVDMSTYPLYHNVVMQLHGCDFAGRSLDSAHKHCCSSSCCVLQSFKR